MRDADMDQDALSAAALKLAEAADADVYLYNGGIERGRDLEFINFVHKFCERPNVILLLTTRGGSPDAGYKMSRYLQDRYDNFTVLIPGLCKSAGTLIAVGATELVFTPYGELGPIDIQKRKIDSLFESRSGLVPTDAIDSIMSEAVNRHIQTYYEIIQSTEGAVSFETAAHLSSELITGMLGPVIRNVDPYDIGENARSVRIALDYAKRLCRRTANIADRAIETLTKSYPSHGFVIDFEEAKTLFTNVRQANEAEMELVEAAGQLCREQLSPNNALIDCLSKTKEERHVESDEAQPGGDRSGDAEATGSATGASSEPTGTIARSNGRGAPDVADEPPGKREAT